MKSESIQAAIDALRISDVYLHKLDCAKSDDFENLAGHAENLVVNTRHAWTRMRAVETQEEARADDDSDDERSAQESRQGPETNNQFLLVHYLAEFYVMNPLLEPVEQARHNQSLDENEIVEKSIAHVSAEFIAEYVLIDPEVSPEALKKFCTINVGYHVWPYWRELARSSAQRMRLPAPDFPFYTVPKNSRGVAEK